MRYMLVVYLDEKKFEAIPEAEVERLLGRCEENVAQMTAAGAFIAAGRLQPTTTATTIRVRDGKTLTTDGPFAETKEQLGGFCLIEAANLDEAIAWAAKMAPATVGSIEIRPLCE